MKKTVILSLTAMLMASGFAFGAETVVGDPTMSGREVMREADNSAAMQKVEANPMQGHRNEGNAEFNRDYMKAMDMMHRPMMEGVMAHDPDVAFVKGMIPHHKGAVEMAKIQLKYGKDPELRRLAQDIIQAQDKEINLMNDWLNKNPEKVNK